MKKTTMLNESERVELELMKSSLIKSKKNKAQLSKQLKDSYDEVESEMIYLEKLASQLEDAESEEALMRRNLNKKITQYRKLKKEVDTKIELRNKKRLEAVKDKKETIILNERILLMEDYLSSNADTEAMKQEIVSTKSRIDSLLPEERKVYDIVNIEMKKINRIKKAVQGLQAKLSSLSNQKEKLNTKRSEIQDDFLRITNVSENIRNTIKNLESENLELSREVAKLKVISKDSRNESDDLGQTLSKANKINTTYKSQISEIKSQIHFLTKDIKSKKELEQAQESQKENDQKTLLKKTLKRDQLLSAINNSSQILVDSFKSRLEREYFCLDIKIVGSEITSCVNKNSKFLKRAESDIRDIISDFDLLLTHGESIEAELKVEENQLFMNLTVRDLNTDLLVDLEKYVSHSFQVLGDGRVVIKKAYRGERYKSPLRENQY